MAGWGEDVPQSGNGALVADNGWGNVATQKAAAVDNRAARGASGGSGAEKLGYEIQELKRKERRGGRTTPDKSGFQTINRKARSANWECDACYFMNFPARMACFKCKLPRPGSSGGGGFPNVDFGSGGGGGQHMEARPGDWECPDCGKVVFKSKSECFSCGAPKPAGLDDGFGGGGFGGSFGGGQKFEARPGDWECPECGKLVFKSKSECFSCGAPKPEGLDDGFGGGGFGGGQKLEARPGDWECPECGKLVFKSKSECFSCGAPKPAGLDDGFGGGGFGGSFGGGQKFEARPGDWECPECGKLVFKSKSECFSCGAPKPEGLDDGFGGGGFGGGQKLEARPGDWECPECGKLVFKSKSECFSCGAAKPEGLDDGFGGGGSGGGFGGGQKFEARPGDWECPECGKLVFRNKSECFSCGAPKPEGLDNGFGGGGSSYGSGSRPGDWSCPECESSNFASRLQCRSCSAFKPEGLGGDEEGAYTRSGSYSSGGGSHGRNSTGKGIVVFNLPWEADADTLACDFADCGRVKKAEIQHDQDGHSKGIGTILFSTEEAAQAAIATYNNTEYGGRELRIKVDSSA